MNRVASILAFVIGMMAIVAGGQTLLGKVPGYNVIAWLPLYNYTMGILTAFVAAPLIWMDNKLALPVSITTFFIHAIIMLILQIAYRDVVAMDSIVAMIIRLITWFIVLALLFFQVRKNKMFLAGG